MAALEIYVLNVGQADTAVIKTPRDQVIVIDACRPQKVKNLLNAIHPGGEIAELVVTHPHTDHYSAVSSLLADCDVRRVTLAPFWYDPGRPGYHQIINRIHKGQIPLRFLSGYERLYPDGGTYPEYENELYLELLGPPNDILESLHESGMLNPNHLSIITRLRYGEFNMVLAGDAQFENWAHYDREGLLEERCDVLKAAHHGSKRGTQWEGLERLSPRLVIVSSDLEGTHDLPDLIGCAIFYEYGSQEGCTVALTRETGTIRITVDSPASNQFKSTAYGEQPADVVPLHLEQALPPTDWARILKEKMGA